MRLECPRDLPPPALLTVWRPSRPNQPAPAGYENPAYRLCLLAGRRFGGFSGVFCSRAGRRRDSEFDRAKYPGLAIHFNRTRNPLSGLL